MNNDIKNIPFKLRKVMIDTSNEELLEKKESKWLLEVTPTPYPRGLLDFDWEGFKPSHLRRVFSMIDRIVFINKVQTPLWMHIAYGYTPVDHKSFNCKIYAHHRVRPHYVNMSDLEAAACEMMTNGEEDTIEKVKSGDIDHIVAYDFFETLLKCIEWQTT